jgi:hypothetical protein
LALHAACIVAALGGTALPAFAACKKTITVTETQQMSYGTIAVTSGGGKVTIAANGTVTAPGGFALSGATAAGRFHVTGSNNCPLVISFTSGSLTGPGTAMSIRNFTTDAGSTPTLHSPGGQFDFDVGADLIVNAAQAGGNYSGTYTVTVIY